MKKNDDEIRRNIRHSIFQDIIGKQKNLRRIYLSIHVEDGDIKEDDLRLIHSSPLIIKGEKYDCCFTIRNEKVIFFEVQSTL